MKHKIVCGPETQNSDWLIETQPRTVSLTCSLYQRLQGFEERALAFELESDSLKVMCNGASAEIRGLGVWNSPMSAERYFITSYCIWFLGNIHRPVWQRNVFRIYRYIQCDMWCSYQRFISSKKCSRRTFTKLECRLLLTCNSSGNIRTKYNIPKTYNTVLTLYN